MRALRGVWERGLARADGRSGALTLFGLAVAIWVVESIGWPLAAGRDISAYLLAYVDLFRAEPVLPWAALSRTPVSPVVVGGLLEIGNPLVLQVLTAGLFGGSVVAAAAAARSFGRGPALLVGLGLVLYPGYGILFHELTGDTVFATGFAVWTLLFVRACDRPTSGRLAAMGFGIAVLVLTRPSSLPLVILALVPFLLAGSIKARALRTALVAGLAVLPLVAWSLHNLVRFDDLTLVRGGQASLPLFRAYVTDRIVSPDNGPASRELAGVVARELLDKEPYRSYGIDLETFFSSGSPRMHEDMISLTDRVYGWDADYAILGRVGREAVRAHPGTYAGGVARDLWELLDQPLFAGRDAPPADAAVGSSGAQPGATGDTIVVGGVTLPRPTEGEPIPSERLSAQESTPDGSIREVWSSPTEHRTVFDDPGRQRRYAENGARISELLSAFPEQRWSPWVGLQMDRSSKLYPRPWMLLLVGLVGLALRRPARARIPLALVFGVVLSLLMTVLAVYAVPDYTVVFGPALLLLAAVGLSGDRDARSTG